MPLEFFGCLLNADFLIAVELVDGVQVVEETDEGNERSETEKHEQLLVHRFWHDRHEQNGENGEVGENGDSNAERDRGTLMSVGSRIVKEAEFRKIAENSPENKERRQAGSECERDDGGHRRKTEEFHKCGHGHGGYRFDSSIFSSISRRFSSMYRANSFRRKRATYEMKVAMMARKTYPM